MRYLIFIPKSDKIKLNDLLCSVGLADHAKGFDALPCRGPGNVEGWLFGWLDHVQTRIGYKPEDQTWIPSMIEGDRKEGAYWVGIWNDSPPTEQDLRRPEGRNGAWVTMADGTKWQFPTPATIEHFPEIKDGKLTWVVDEQFAWFCSDLEKMRATRITWTEGGNGSIRWNPEEDFNFIVRAFRINYRITPEVFANLRLMSFSLLKSIVSQVLRFRLSED